MPAATINTPALDAARASRDALQTQIDTALAATPPTDIAELRASNAAVQELIEQRAAFDERVRVLEEQEARRQADANTQERLGAGAGRRATITREPRTYDPLARHSYFLDLVRDKLGQGDGDGGVQAARDRLRRHEQELVVELPAREEARDRLAAEQAERVFTRDGYNRRARESAFERRTNPNRTDGQGGFFVPPTWLIDEYIDLPRFGRTTANLCQQLTLPSGTDSINLPKIATGTKTGAQTDGGAVTKQDPTDTFVSAAVTTSAGQIDVAMQLLDQSPVGMDEIFFADLQEDFNQQLDIDVITAILATAGINTITYTDSTPTLGELWSPMLQGASKIATGRKAPATAAVMTPAQWYWSLSNLDGQGRPLILPNPNAMNNMGENGALDFDGPVGMWTFGLPSYIDGNIPANLGAGTNESRIIEARWQDLYLWQGALRTRVLTEVLSGTLEVRLQVYGYKAFMPNRRPASISVLQGTGLAAPAGF